MYMSCFIRRVGGVCDKDIVWHLNKQQLNSNLNEVHQCA
jgi:hypothetical protein